jgi:hypothetical protein
VRDAARVDALKAVRRDRDELERYARSGVPPRLGLGLYRGAPLLAPVNALIAGYQPPPPPPVPPPTIELDSMSLFRSGMIRGMACRCACATRQHSQNNRAATHASLY